jgi:hypothetical protein
MHHLDALILRNAVKQLDKALAEMKAGGMTGEILASLSISWAKTDIEAVLNTQPVEERA